ncbi:Hypothetical predicted protein [Paramuricea clavata]|uniref:Uncharacterized protein n=1 Tax=Paramuricea clavata TaxID=317549 RepID=A0A7D9KXZ6_PARCT|nr:Hypothetical predicted protein [Paramuricea clavata]
MGKTQKQEVETSIPAQSQGSVEGSRLNYQDLITHTIAVMFLLANNMKEIRYKNTDKFVQENVTVTVTCKPKKVYPSSAMNWVNDLYSICHLFPEEHEIGNDTESITLTHVPDPVGKSACTSDSLIDLSGNKFDTQLQDEHQDFQPLSMGILFNMAFGG